MSKNVRTKLGTAEIFYSAKITPKDKKYSVRTPSGKLIHFGARGMQQYKDQALGKYSKLNHGDKKRRDRYRSRHSKDMYNDPERPSYYSWRYLW